MLSSVYETLLEDVRSACLAYYGSRLAGLAVFGSVARGTPRPDSDIDLLVVVDKLPRSRLARVAEFGPVEDALEQVLARARDQGVDTRLSPVFKTPDELEAGSLLLLDMTDQARLLHDRDGLLARRFERLRARLRELGSRRVSCKGGYYWLLKPDLEPGEVVRL
jgi:predicted nucleotidyltransferase